MNNYEFVAKLVEVAKNYKTLYVMGCFGAPLTEANKKRYIAAQSYNQSADRKKVINAATADTFGFDCVCLIKGVLWGWNGDPTASYGGANYASNGVPDIGADSMITKCKGISYDFGNIEVGEAVWCPGHIGVYIGDGLAVECSPRWEDKVQITACNNPKAGYNMRTWSNHGKLPWVEYVAPKKKTVEEVAKEVIAGKWGVGSERKRKLTQAGYNYSDVQNMVNKFLAEAEKASKGDIDGDGKVTATDARLALRAAVGLENLTEAQIKAADMDNDGKITAADSRAILEKSVK